MPTRKKKVAILFAAAHPAYVQKLRGIEDYAAGQPTWTLSVNPEPFVHLAVSSLEGWRGDGVLVRLVSQADVRAAKALGIPVVNVGGLLQDTGLPSAHTDQKAVGRAAANHLLDRGFRRFAFYGLRDTWYSEQRRDGFAERLREEKRKCTVLEVPETDSRHQPWDVWLAPLERWLRKLKPPVGLFAVHDVRASLVAKTCLRLGLRVPEDVAVVGMENNEVVCELASVRLSSVFPNNRQVGFEAAALLDRLMIGDPRPETTLLVPPVGVVRRESTDVIAVEDAHVVAAARYIHDHLGEDFNIETLTKTTGISRRGFERHFKDCLGCTPHQYVSRARVARAEELLVEADSLPLKKIAKACGFSSAQHFRLAFHRVMGMTPAEYRHAHESKGLRRFE